jgi:hypothetical protein
MRPWVVALVVFLGACGAAGARSSSTLPGWMVGSWRSESVVEAWHPAGRGLIGFGAAAKDGATRFYEVMTITPEGAGLVYNAMPMGHAAVPFRGSAAAGGGRVEVVFRNPEHDFPKEVGYARDGERLLAHTSAPEGPREDFAYGPAGGLARASELEAADLARGGAPTASGMSVAGDVGNTVGRRGQATYLAVWRKAGAAAEWAVIFETSLAD